LSVNMKDDGDVGFICECRSRSMKLVLSMTV
jgi:hypothetical protein